MNKLKDRCRLSIGDSFIYRGEYCTVTGFRYKHFIYTIQNKPKVMGYMDYEFYLTTPSSIGRKLNKKH
jgi:hypothetical protein